MNKKAMSNPFRFLLHPHPAVQTGAVLAVVAVLLLGWGAFSRMKAQAALQAEAQAESVIPVLLAKPTVGGNGEVLVLPGTLQAYTDAPIYARTSGYVKKWLVDIGATVKPGQLLAEIDTPEIDQQLAQAQADLKMAEANNDLAQLTATRWRGLLATNSVSKQDADNRIGDAAAKAAALASAQANLQRLRELQGFERIVAPFDGVITARNLDIGDLIDAGSGSGKARELFHLADIRRLRVYVQMPENYARDMRVGNTATLQVREHPGKAFEAKLVNTANAIDPTTHTLLVQLEVDNALREMLPGGYVEVNFKLAQRADSMRIPANTLIFGRAGMQVAVVGSDNRVVLQPVTLGRDFGKEVEVLTGLKPDQQIVINPLDSLVTGQAVKSVQPEQKLPVSK
jgi:RND family efflux transporter MFP subunit